MMDLIRCPQCAKEIPDVSRFCRRCGSAMAWGAAAATATSWAGLPLSAWDAARPEPEGFRAFATTTKRHSHSTPKPSAAVKRGGGGGSAWAASAMIGVAAFMVVSHVHRATIGPMVAPRPAARVSPVRTPPPLPPQLTYPRSAVRMGDGRIYLDPPLGVPPKTDKARDEDHRELRGYRWDGPDRRGAGWGEDSRED